MDRQSTCPRLYRATRRRLKCGNGSPDAAGSAEGARYGAIEGDAELRHAYADHLASLYRAPVSTHEVHITAGCNEAFIVASMAVAGPGDRILLTNPCYFNHDTSLAMLGIGIDRVPCRPENRFVPTVADIEASLLPETRAVALVTPNNPTGAVYSPDALKDVFELCTRRNIWLILDETYRDFLAPEDGPPHNLFTEPSWRDRVIQLYSFSKAYCIPGHRLGAVMAGDQVVTRVAKIMDNLQICAPRTAQIALVKAIPALADWRAANAREIARRADAFQSALDGAEGWDVMAIGAYFAYLRHPFDTLDGVAVAQRLAEQYGVLGLPGTYFGSDQEQYLRLAFANVGSDKVAGLPERLTQCAADIRSTCI